MSESHAPLQFISGGTPANRFMLSPMTNQQSHEDGTLSDDEYRWLVKRAEGGFGMVVSCAAHVQTSGKAWPGQLGVFDDVHVEGLGRLAAGLKAFGSHAAVQLFHGGRRAEPGLVGDQALVAPSNDPDTRARALTEEEVESLRDDFIAAAYRCRKAGFDGVEIHAAHGYVICQFLSSEFNRREDDYGGTPERRAKLLHEIIRGVRDACGPKFSIGVRLSPERHGLIFPEMYALAGQLLGGEQIDYLDMSMQDAFRMPDEEAYRHKSLTEWYAGMPRDRVALGVGGSLLGPEDVRRVMDLGADFVVLARAGIVHHDFPRQMRNDPNFNARRMPVPASVLSDEGLSDTFITYLRTFPDFVEGTR